MINHLNVTGSAKFFSTYDVSVAGSVLTVKGALRYRGEDIAIPETTHTLSTFTESTDVEVYLVRVKSDNSVAVLVDEMVHGAAYNFKSPTSLYTCLERIAWFRHAPGGTFDTIDVTVVDIVQLPEESHELSKPAADEPTEQVEEAHVES